MTASNQLEQEIAEKLTRLQEYLLELGSVAVAFSSGVDSTFLLKVAKEVLREHVIAITAKASFFPKREFEEAVTFCQKEGIQQVICEFDGLSVEGFRNNSPERCYFCKKNFFQKMQKIAEERGIGHIIEGSNMDDETDYRPGLKAVSQLGILSPLRAVGFYKTEIRACSKTMGLSTWKKPSYACLASRFVYGEPITREKLKMVEQAEQFLWEKGFRQCRVRMHDYMARIEVLPEEFENLMEKDLRQELVMQFQSYGFSYISMDLNGYRTGSMNEVLSQEEKVGSYE